MFNKCDCGEENCKCGCKNTPKLINLVLIFLAIFLISQALIGFQKLPNVGNEVYPQSTIAVSGSGEAYAVPDIATFSFSVTETAATVKAAQEKVDVKINKALSAARESGVEEKDIKTANYNVYPKYEWLDAICSKPENIISASGAGVNAIRSDVSYCPPGKQVLNGYEVTQSIIVKVRDTEKAGDLVTKVGASGVSNISGLEFSVDKRDDYVAKAREDAIEEAKSKAKELAKQLGVHLGKIVYYNENGNYPVYSMKEGMGGADMAVSSAVPAKAELPTGETKITSDVNITYEIK
jgi:uncharacterized protein